MSRWLVSTSRSVLVVDGGRGDARVLHEGSGLYFGLSFDEVRGGFPLYVGARRRMVSSPSPREGERGTILLLGEDLRVAGELQAPFPMRDLHQVLVRDGTLWATCSFDNRVAVHRDGQWDAWYPLGEPVGEPRDVNHFNTLEWIDGHLVVLAHNRDTPPSEILVFEWPSRRLASRIALGAQAHDVWREGGLWHTLDSLRGRVVNESGWFVETGGFPRGIAFAGDEICLGISEHLIREARDDSTGQLQFRDPQWRLTRTLALDGEGLVLDIEPFPEGLAIPPEAPARTFRFL